MAVTLPSGQSMAQPVNYKNFMAYQSAKLSVENSSDSVTFTVPATAQNVTAKISNTGTVGCYLASSTTSSATAILSVDETANPTTGEAVSNCDYIAPGTIQVLDFPPGTTTFAAITASSTTTLEISVGFGG